MRPETTAPPFGDAATGDHPALPGAPADGDRFVASDPPVAPAADAAAALSRQVAAFGEAPPARAAEIAEALRLLTAEAARTPDAMRAQNNAYAALSGQAVEGDAVALVALETLAQAGVPLSGGARVLIENRERLAAAARATDAIEFGRRYVALGDEIVDGVRALLRAGDDPARRGRFVRDAVNGLLGPLRTIFLRRFAGDHSVEESAIRHEIFGGFETTILVLGLGSPDEVRGIADMIAAPVSGDDLHAQLLRAIRYPHAFAESMNVSLQDDIPRGLRFREGFDPALVLQGVGELIWNAVKYHVGRSVREGRFVRLAWDAADGAFIIEDNGSGIERPGRAFEPGYREAARYPGERRGTGMGLANLKRHLDAIGWTIEVESIVNIGTRFIITPRAGDVVDGSTPPAAGGGSFGGVVEVGGSESGGGGETAAPAEPLEEADPMAVMGVDATTGSNTGPAAIVGVPVSPSLVK